MDYEEMAKLGLAFGSALHEDWKKQNAYRQTRFKKAGKDMDGNVIREVPSDVPSRINEEGVLEIDILNTPFEKLTPAWKQENLDAGMFIASLIMHTPGLSEELLSGNISQSTMDMIGSRIHDAWMSRPNNSWAKKSPEEIQKMTDTEKDEYQFKPYNELNQRNKDLDTDQIKVVIEIIRQHKGLANLISITELPKDADALQQLKQSVELYAKEPGITFQNDTPAQGII